MNTHDVDLNRVKIHAQIFLLNKTKKVSVEPRAGVFVRSLLLRRSGAIIAGLLSQKPKILDTAFAPRVIELVRVNSIWFHF